ncbi:MAG: divergent PAP2 family protein [Bacillota bacterium]|jgi:acid phosphatase family membrane protein YuiD
MLFNPIFEAALTAWLLAQILKVIFELLFRRRLDFGRLVGAGGMPSSHAAFVAALSTAVGRIRGWDSPELAISLVFALIIMYDAAGVRRAAGKQARILNRIMADLQQGGRLFAEGERLKEFLGHTPVEVLAGAALGAIVSIFFLNYLGL